MTAAISKSGAVICFAQVLENTPNHADSRPDSAALSRPYSVKVSMGGMGHRVSMAARRDSCFQHPAHPLPLENGKGGFCLITEPETMTPKTEGQRAHVPAHYVRRLARSIILRAGIKGRLSWPVVFVMLDRIGGAA